jgi:hypothetical protein
MGLGFPSDLWSPANKLMQQQHHSMENDHMFGRVSTQPSDVQGYVPASEYQHVRNGMMRPPGATLPLASQQGAVVQGNANQAGPAVPQLNQGGPAMDHQSHETQQVPIGMDGDYRFNPNDPLAVPGRASTTMSPATYHGGAPQAGANWGSPAMARPNQGGVVTTQQGPSSDGNIGAPGYIPTGPTDSGPVVDSLSEYFTFEDDTQFNLG